MNAATTPNSQHAGFPPAPPEAHQRADEGAGEGHGVQATYSPEDNKLRLRSAARLSAEISQRLRDAGFAWAPRQRLHVAPMWTPAREDLLLELCGRIDAETSTLAERAAERVERFEDYSEKRGDEAGAAQAGAAAIASQREFGQPIFVGHHSERRARKDQTRINAGMRKAVQLWDTAGYWAERAKAVQRHADYKADAGVRHRRIKTLTAALRKKERDRDESAAAATAWGAQGLSLDQAKRLANAGGMNVAITVDGKARSVGLWMLLEEGKTGVVEASALATARHDKFIAWCDRWIAHYSNRIAYESAFVEGEGGAAAQTFDIEVGGLVKARGDWLQVLRINRKDGKIASVSTSSRLGRIVDAAEITDYRPGDADEAARVAGAMKLPPICNYPAEGFVQMTRAEWDSSPTKHLRRLGENATERRAVMPLDAAASVAAKPAGLHRVRTVMQAGKLLGVFITDKVRRDPPPATAARSASSVEDGEASA